MVSVRRFMFSAMMVSALMFTALSAAADPYPSKFEGMFKDYERHPMDLIAHFLPCDPTICEAGGLYGMNAINCTNKWPELKKVISFEPNPHAFKIFMSATKGHDKIQGYNLAVHEFNGKAVLNICHGTTGKNSMFESASSLLKAASGMEMHYQGPKVEVPCVILDDWCKQHNISHIDCLWLGVEGVELQVLRSSPSILSTVKIIYTDTIFYPFRIGITLFPELRTFLESSGFVLLSHWYREGLKGNAIFVRKEVLECTPLSAIPTK